MIPGIRHRALEVYYYYYYYYYYIIIIIIIIMPLCAYYPERCSIDVGVCAIAIPYKIRIVYEWQATEIEHA